MLNGNQHLPRVLDVEPTPANDLVLESNQGKLKPKASRRFSVNLPQAVLWQVELQASSRAPHTWVWEGSHMLTRGRLSPLEVDPAPAMLRGNTLGWFFPFPLGFGFGCGEDLGSSSGIEGGSGLCTPGAKAELSKGNLPLPLPRLTQRGLGSISKPLPLPMLLSGGTAGASKTSWRALLHLSGRSHLLGLGGPVKRFGLKCANSPDLLADPKSRSEVRCVSTYA